jgi:hypothetical protein
MSRSGLLVAWQAANVAEPEWTAIRPRARHQVLASGIHRRDQVGADDPKIIETASTIWRLPQLAGRHGYDCGGAARLRRSPRSNASNEI